MSGTDAFSLEKYINELTNAAFRGKGHSSASSATSSAVHDGSRGELRQLSYITSAHFVFVA